MQKKKTRQTYRSPEDPMVIRLDHRPVEVVRPQQSQRTVSQPEPSLTSPPTAEPPRLPKKPRPAGSWFVRLIILVVIITGIGVAFTRAPRELPPVITDATTTPNVVPETSKTDSIDSTVDILARVSKLILLPANEEPTVAAITNLDVLKDEAFFANAKLGDIVIMYAEAKKAFLYDPKADKVIEVAPIISNPQ